MCITFLYIFFQLIYLFCYFFKSVFIFFKEMFESVERRALSVTTDMEDRKIGEKRGRKIREKDGKEM